MWLAEQTWATACFLPAFLHLLPEQALLGSYLFIGVHVLALATL